RGDLPCRRRREPGLEISERPADIPVRRLALDEEQRLAVFDGDEINLASFDVPEISQLGPVTLRVLPEVKPLHEMRGNQVLESRSLVRHDGPVEVIVLAGLL